MAQESWFGRIWRLMTPELVYFGICYLVDMAAGIYWGYIIMDDYISDSVFDIDGFTSVLVDRLLENAMLLQTISAFVAIFFLLRMYFRDYKRRRFLFDKSSVGSLHWLLLIPAGVFAALAGNMLMNLTDFAAMSEGFQESEQILFSGPFIVQVIGIGIIIPICEELVYRGLIYMRLRQYLNVNIAIVGSALIFGFIHGNIVQGIYGFLVGILFTYVYEKYGSLKAPVLTHISANMLSMVLVALQPSFASKTPMLLIGGAAVILCLAVIMLIDKTVDAPKVYLD